MAVTVTHPFVSAISDGADATVVRPSNWNATHSLTGTVDVANGGTGASTASITSFNNITGYTASGATGTTSTNLVFSASPTFTGTLGAAAITASTTLGVTGVSTLTGGAVIQGLTVGLGANAVANNTAVGVGVMASGSLSGVNNTAVGYNALPVNTTGDNNVAIGQAALTANLSGYNNTAVGQAALYLNTSGVNNTSLGGSALGSNVSGSTNLALGRNAGSALTTGSNNTIIGSVAGTAGLSDTVIIAAGSAERMRIDSSGNVGIGTTSPSGKLQVQQTTDGTLLRLQRTGGSNIPILQVNLTESTNLVEFEATGATGPSITFKVGAAERLQISSAGTVSIASTTEQSGTTGALTVAGGVYVAKKLTAIGGISGGTF